MISENNMQKIRHIEGTKETPIIIISLLISISMKKKT
jgi:hypothetical protein